MESGLLLDVIIGQRATIFELLSGEYQTLRVRRNALPLLDFSLNTFNEVGRLNVKGESVTAQVLDEDLHAAEITVDNVNGRFRPNVVVTKGSAILELFTPVDET